MSRRPKKDSALASQKEAAALETKIASDAASTPGAKSFEFPKVSDPNFRIACNEVADQLARNWHFKFQVIVGAFAILSVLGLVVGFSVVEHVKSLAENVKTESSALLAEAKASVHHAASETITKAQQDVEEELRNRLSSEGVKKTVEEAASTSSAALFKKLVEPALADFEAGLKDRTSNLEKNLEQFRKSLADAEFNASESRKKIDEQLAVIEERNKVMRLGDSAISDGSVESYHALEKMAKEGGDTERGRIAIVELYRVFTAYGPLAPSRISGVKIYSKKLNAARETEEDLTAEDIMNAWPNMNDGLGRARLAFLMKNNARVGSLKQATFVVEALKAETHLEAHKQLKSLFRVVTGCNALGRLDSRDELAWWEKNKEELEMGDTDPRPLPAVLRDGISGF